jgi:histidinol-phosphate aminotransferase
MKDMKDMKETKESILSRLRPEVRAIHAYSLEARSAAVKLDQNENTMDPPEPIQRGIEEALSRLSVNRYPPTKPAELKEALAGLNDWSADGVLVGNGSNELLQMVALSTLEPGRKAVLPSPSFAVYSLVVRVLGARLVEVPLRDDLSYDIDRFLATVEREQPSLVFLCAPNNPTGSALGTQDVERIAEGCPGMLLVDEAYFEFGGSASRELLPRFRHLVICRTFSKAMGLAALRIGYMLAHPEVASELAKAQLPFSLNSFSRAAALVVCRHYGLVRARAEETVKERDALFEKLAVLPGIHPYPSKANFILFRSDAGSEAVFAGLLKRSVLVRDVSAYPKLSECLRVTVGTAEENERFVNALRETLEELS